MMMLGNLTIERMEDRLGIKFPSELIEYMTPRRQEHANDIAIGAWHCFDIPFTLVCGDIETAKAIHEFLLPFSKDMKTSMGISWTRDAPDPKNKEEKDVK